MWSYAFYLIHGTVIAVYDEGLSRVFGLEIADVGAVAAVGHCAVMLAESVVAAWLLHICVERPVEKRLRPRTALRSVVADG